MTAPPSLASLRIAVFTAAGLAAPACDLRPLPIAATGASSSASTGGAAATSSQTSSIESSSASTGGAGGTGGSGGADPVCDGAVGLDDPGGAPTGFAKCPDMTVHRSAAVACNSTIDVDSCVGTEMTIDCTADSDCTAAPHGRCLSQSFLDELGVKTSCDCVYSCATDDECGPGSACVCNGVGDNGWATCVPATCSSGADCPSGECGLSDYYDGCSFKLALGCRDATDACRTAGDCAAGPGTHKSCGYTDDGMGGPVSWQCIGWTCILGRPFVVEGESRVAEVAHRGDWSAEVRIAAASLSECERRARAAEWTAVARLEHASIASFARFTLELLSLGAPPELVAEAQRAALDEIEHARVAFGVAGAFAGAPVGPGKLDVPAASTNVDRRSVIRSVVAEACVGETLGVAEAIARAARENDTELRAIHATIAEDEKRHAELAWRTLRWLLGDASSDELALARTTFDEAIVACSEGAPDAELHAARLAAIRDVIRPAADAIVSRAS